MSVEKYATQITPSSRQGRHGILAWHSVRDASSRDSLATDVRSRRDRPRETRWVSSLPREARAFTLIELLVVIAIMSALTALMLPRLRTVNEDRNIREAARVVGSKFAEASQRAINDGVASLTIVRNPNMVDSGGPNSNTPDDDVEYAGTTLYVSRAVPNYVGDGVYTPAAIVKASHEEPAGSNEFYGVVRIPRPLEQDFTEVIRVGDSIRLDRSAAVSSPVAYRIVAYDPSTSEYGGLPPRSSDFMDLVIRLGSLASPKPPLPSGANISFVVERQPKILESSIQDLPAGYIIDLRLSGPLHDATTSPGVLQARRTTFQQPFTPALKALAQDNPSRVEAREITIIFGADGGIKEIRRYDPVPPGTNGYGDMVTDQITGPLHLFVTPLTSESAVLFKDTNLWVTISNSTGGVNVGYNNPPLNVGTNLLSDLIPVARSDAETGQSAAQ